MPAQTTHLILLVALSIIVIGLFVRRFKPTLVFGWVTMALLMLGVMPMDVMLDSLSNKSIITIFLLIFITSALRRHFNLLELLDKLYRNIRSPRRFLLAMTSSVAALSSVVNNTPIVAIMIPYVYDWSKRHNYSPSRFLIPLSYAATLGGTITVIGTSTNLVLNGLLEANDLPTLGFADFLVPGLLVTVVGVIYLTIFGHRLLSDRIDILQDFQKNKREYIVETVLHSSSDKVGRSVADAGLRNLEGVFLVEIMRDGQLISPVTPNEVLQSGDLLYFAGEVEKVVDLLRNDNGFEIAKREKLDSSDSLEVVEVLVPLSSGLAGKKVKDTNFRERYDAAIVAIHRDGRRLGGKLGDVELEFGDLLLLTTGSRFQSEIQNSKDLYTISIMERIERNGKREKKWVGALAGLGFVALAFGWIDLFTLLLLIMGVLATFKMITIDDLRKDLNADLLIILTCAVALGTTLIHTGTAGWISDSIVGMLHGTDPITIMIAVMLLTVLLTSFVTNVAAVAVAFPIVAALGNELGMDATPLYLALAYGASASFITPVSYQTNLMVYGPGGYKSADFARVGWPLTLLYMAIIMVYLILNFNLI